MRKILMVFLLLFFPILGETSSTKLTEGRLIRRLYLEVLHIPPTPHELEWFLVYNSDAPYKTALEHLNIKDLDLNLYCLEDLKKREAAKLSSSQLDDIIKYQSGIFASSTEQCKEKIVKDSMAMGDHDPVEGFDYMSECLTGRTLTTEESNDLLKKYRSYPSTEKGYTAVLNELLNYKDYLFD